MKKIVYNRFGMLLFLALYALATACSKERSALDPEPMPEELIIGKWYVEKIIKADGTVQEPANDCEKDSHYKFDDENEIISVSFYLDGDECKRSIGAGEYLLAGNGTKLVVTASDGTTSTIDILTLNASTLELKIGGDTAYLKKGT